MLLKLKHSLFILLFATGSALSQISISGQILDSETGLPIPFCAVGVKNTSKGCLSNENGEFKLTYLNTNDTLAFVSISYKQKNVALSQFLTSGKVALVPKEKLLQQVEIYNTDYYLYQLFQKCRKKLKSSTESESKVHFTLATEIENQPVELLECYYNARQNACAINNLAFKNGRVGIAPYKNRYFVSLNTSKAISFIDLVNHTGQFPLIPFQLGMKKLQNHFKLTLLNTYYENGLVHHIAFKDNDNKKECFSGEAWIDNESGQLINLKLEVNKTQKHPFLALFPDGKIEDVSIQISKSYATSNTVYFSNHLDFNYQLNYRVNDSLRVVKSKGVMFFYDQDKPFILPFFNYNNELEDYRKITSLSFNEQFWRSANGLLYSENMIKGLNYFKKNGQLLNYTNDGNKKTGLLNNALFENSNLIWSAKKRIQLKTNGIKQDTLNTSQTFVYQRYKLKAQIFLDINETPDSTGHLSVTVFDTYQTFYNLSEEKCTACFFNIYFDLIELERRKMEREIYKLPRSKQSIESIYQNTLKSIDNLELNYFKEVERGKNIKALKKYNIIVATELGINNIELLGCDNN